VQRDPVSTQRDQPLWKQIADDLRDQIDSGELAGGQQVPTEKGLRTRYAASRNTVRQAIKYLEGLGLVLPQAGRGTFVSERIEPFVTTLGRGPGVGGETASYLSEVEMNHRTPVNRPPKIEVQRSQAAPELQLNPEAQVVSRHQERLIDQKPYSLQTTFYPIELYERGAKKLLDPQNLSPGAVAYLTEEVGVTEVGWSDIMSVRPPKAEEADFFGVPDDGRVPIFEIRRTTFQDTGEPLRLTVTSYPTDRNLFRIDIGQVPEHRSPVIAVGRTARTPVVADANSSANRVPNR
jgi:GntR family transcriptional regulator